MSGNGRGASFTTVHEPNPIDSILVGLCRAFRAGEDVRAPLGDRLEELGFPTVAALHFRGDIPCRPGADCDAVDAILNGDERSLRMMDANFGNWPYAPFRPPHTDKGDPDG